MTRFFASCAAPASTRFARSARTELVAAARTELVAAARTELVAAARTELVAAARTGLAIFASAALLSGCRSAPPVAPPPTPTPPPSVTAGGPAFLEEDGSVRYHLVIRADAGVAFLPISVTALAGTGRIGWTRWTEATFAYDEAADRYVPMPRSEGGEKREEWVNIVFPGSNQEMGIDVEYAGEPPPEERFRVVYATLGLGELATHTYVKPGKSAPGEEGEAVPREPLGDRLRSVDVSRWLTSGFFVPDIQTLDEVVVTVPGPKRKTP